MGSLFYISFMRKRPEKKGMKRHGDGSFALPKAKEPSPCLCPCLSCLYEGWSTLTNFDSWMIK